MASLIDRHAHKIVGVLSCFDRVVIQGTMPSVCDAGAVATLLDARGLRMFDYGPLFADPFRQGIRSRVERLGTPAAKGGARKHPAQLMRLTLGVGSTLLSLPRALRDPW